MIIIWRGAGIVVPVLGFGSLVGMQLAVNAAGGEGYWNRHGWPLQAAFALTAVTLWLLGRRLNARAPTVHMTRPAAGWPRARRRAATSAAAEGVRIKHYAGKHSFFYVPMEWWGPLVGVALVAVTAWDLLKDTA